MDRSRKKLPPPEKTRILNEVPVSFKLDDRLVRELDLIAEAESRTRSGTVRLALLEFVRSRKEAEKRVRA